MTIAASFDESNRFINDFIFFDCETNGLRTYGNEPEIVEISFWVLKRCQLEQPNEHWHDGEPRLAAKLTLPFKSIKMMPENVRKLTGISTDMLELWNGATKAHEELIVSFLRSLGDGPFCLIAHNATNFDVPLLLALLRQIGSEKFPQNVFWADTLEAFKKLDKDEEEDCNLPVEELNPVSVSLKSKIEDLQDCHLDAVSTVNSPKHENNLQYDFNNGFVHTALTDEKKSELGGEVKNPTMGNSGFLSTPTKLAPISYPANKNSLGQQYVAYGCSGFKPVLANPTAEFRTPAFAKNGISDEPPVAEESQKNSNDQERTPVMQAPSHSKNGQTVSTAKRRLQMSPPKSPQSYQLSKIYERKFP